jgi:hypothetical protein
MKTIRAHFDGSVFIPDEPVNLPSGTEVHVFATGSLQMKLNDPPVRAPLADLIKLMESIPDDSSLPPDCSMNFDHYLYGHPKRSE